MTPSTRPSPVRLFTRPFVLASAVNLLQGMSFFLFVHLPRFLEGLGANEVGIGAIYSAAAVASILVRPRVGMEMDRRGRRPLILAGGVLNVAVIPLYLTVTSLGPWVVAVRIIHGVAMALLFTSLFTYGADQVPPQRRTEGLALFGASGLIPMAVGGWLGDVVLVAGSFDALFLTSLGFALASLVVSTQLTEAKVAAVANALPGGRLRRVLRRADLLPLWFITLAVAIVLTAYFTFMRTFIDQTGVGSVGGFFAAYAATAILLRAFAGWLPDRVGRKRVFYPSLGAVAAGFVVLATAESAPGLVVAGVLCGGGLGYAFPILYALVVERAPLEDRGSAMAVFTGLFDAGTLAGGPTLGFVILHFGYGAMFGLAAAWIVAISLVYALWEGDLSRHRQPLVPPT